MSAEDRARRLYPDSAYLQAEYLRAMQVVNTTRRGWLLSKRVPRRPSEAPINGNSRLL